MSKLPAECSGGDKLSRICIYVLRVRRGRLCLLPAVRCAAASCHHSRRHSLSLCNGKTNSKCTDFCKRPYTKTCFRGQKMVLIFGTKTVPKFGTKSVPKIGTIFGSRVSEMLLHAFQKCWYKEFGSIEPDGSHWWAGLVAAIMHCGGSFWLALRHACLRN